MNPSRFGCGKSLGLALGLLGVLAVGEPARPAAAQEPPPEPPAHGTQAFRRVLHDLGLQPLERIDQLRDRPDRTILIVLGDTRPLEQLRRFFWNPTGPAGLPAYVNGGGAVLVATDRQLMGGDIDAAYGIRVIGQKRELNPADARLAYRNTLHCPLVLPSADGEPPLFRGLAKVATNRPSYLDVPFRQGRAQVTVPARLPISTGIGEPASVPFAAAARSGAGRVLVLADHSVFINEMMLQTDNDNIDLAYRCVGWLSGEGPNPRDRVLFIDEGEVVPYFDVPLAEPPLPSIGDLAKAGNELIRGLEKENAFNRLLEETVGYDNIWKAVLLVLSLGLVVLGMHRLMGARYRPETKVPLAAVGVARLVPGDPAMLQRQQAMLLDGNFWEPARDMARALFESVREQQVGPPRAGAPDPSLLGDHFPVREPEVTVSAGWWQGYKLRQQVLYLWRLAYGDRAVHVSPTQFVGLAAQIDQVKAALLDGRVQLNGTGENG